MAFAYSLDIPVTALEQLLQRLKPRLPYVILESAADIRFELTAPPPGTTSHSADEWSQGRAFGPDCELRWRPRRDGARVLCITEQSLSPEETADLSPGQPVELEPAASETLTCALWGELQQAESEPEYAQLASGYAGPLWYEERVPRFLAYPWDQASGAAPERAAISVIRYRVSGEQSPANHVYRFCSLEAFPPESPVSGKEAA
ncbi:MAG: hypothetical protein ACO1SX_08445 [Actinomycetota bacterium]